MHSRPTQGFLRATWPTHATHTEVQARVPEGALVLPNHHGTAPGLVMEVNPNPFRSDGKPAWLVMLPGPPRELRPMFTNQVLPLLREKLPLAGAFILPHAPHHRHGRVHRGRKNRRAAQAADGRRTGTRLLRALRGVDVRLVTRGHNAEQLADEAEAIIRQKLGPYIFGAQDDRLNEIVVRLLTERKEALVLAESCTGGYVASQITDVPGASAVFLCGLVTYSNEAKQQLLGVRPETLAQHGAVSEATAREMAEGARSHHNADYAIAITGIAGPTGGTDTKPVGTVSSRSRRRATPLC